MPDALEVLQATIAAHPGWRLEVHQYTGLPAPVYLAVRSAGKDAVDTSMPGWETKINEIEAAYASIGK